MLLKLQMFLNGECPAARPNLQAEGAVPEYGHKLAALRRRQVDTVLGRSSHTPKYHGKIESQARSGPDSKPSQDVDFGLLLQRCLQWKDIILDLISLSKSPALAAPSSRPTCSKAEQSTHTHIVYVTEASLGLSAGKVVVSSVRSSWLLQKGAPGKAATFTQTKRLIRSHSCPWPVGARWRSPGREAPSTEVSFHCSDAALPIAFARA